ncbi:hypothetical protein IS519_20460 [Vibrio crassostreae]|uniref:hypothetical protein n=1 Tax=Vibrio crassostreae TaxID=246167 RepID=UPI00200B5CEC|nr:hypothetical protein [Vibrio crassostreae]UPR32897.1 hypothetical protein IS519_20460 [Vibrio crassostreae]
MRITSVHIGVLVNTTNRHMPTAQFARSSGSGKHQIDMKVGNTGAQSHLSGVGLIKETYEFMIGFGECLNLQQYVGHKLVLIM